MIAQPPIVKIVVPIPPVDGRAESFVSVMLAVPVRLSGVCGFSSVAVSHVALESSVLTE